ncbi:MAG: glycosyltransferase [Lewinella sp.]|uniref:glycosyltransferase n=1 Tax=Lewinella sp. TaxID=2004506 RepID=UPI003D6B1619
MRILIICGSFYPIQAPRSFRSTELAKEFARQGHEVTVLTPRNNEVHNQFEQTHTIRIQNLGRRTYFAPLPARGITHWLMRIRNRFLQLFFEYPHIQFYFQVRRALKRQSGYDLLISVAVPHPIHWGVASVWRLGRSANNPAKVWVADCGDPFMYNRHDTFRKPFYFHYFENNFLKKADYITVPFEEMKDLFNRTYLDKFRVIPQGFRFSQAQAYEYQPHPIPTFIYSGAVIPGHRDPFSLIEFLESEQVEYRFILYAKNHHQFNSFKALIGKRIFLRDYIPREQLLVELTKADFLVNVNTDRTGGIINAVPTKLIDYRISGRPILSYEQSHLPTETIREFLVGNYRGQFVDENFDRYRIENVAQKFLALD